MGFSHDYFVAALRCPVCGHVSAPDHSTNMWTYIRDEPELAYLRVGDRLDVPIHSMEDLGYLTISVPRAGEELRLLHPWRCPNCGTINWAEVVVRDGIIADIAAVPLDRDVLEGANFISNEALGTAVVLTGRSVDDLIGADVVQVLREHL